MKVQEQMLKKALGEKELEGFRGKDKKRFRVEDQEKFRVKDEEGFRENDKANLYIRLRKGLKKRIVKLYFLLVIYHVSKLFLFFFS